MKIGDHVIVNFDYGDKIIGQIIKINYNSKWSIVVKNAVNSHIYRCLKSEVAVRNITCPKYLK